MDCDVRLLIVFILAWANVPIAAYGRDTRSIEQVSAIMSPIPFGSITSEQLRKLRIEGDLPCIHWTDCSYYAHGPVAHSVYDGKIVGKWLKVVAGEQIAAFGIGFARLQAAVLPKVEARIGKPLNCSRPSAIAEMECLAEIGEGSLSLQFDQSGKLSSVYLQNWTAP